MISDRRRNKIISNDDLFDCTQQPLSQSGPLLLWSATPKCYSWNVCCPRRCPEGVVLHVSPRSGTSRAGFPVGNES